MIEKYRYICKDIEQIALRCGRDPASITVVAVTKGHPWHDIEPLYHEGCRIFGESRIQEAEEKWKESPKEILWHLIGALQKNKVRKAIGHFTLIHSVSSYEIAKKISECSVQAGVMTSILLQANTSGEPTKQGLSPYEWKLIFSDLLQLPGLQVQGWMTMAPLVEDTRIIRQCFADLRRLRDELGHLPHLSMGMSHDYRIAIEEGATLVRIGTALF